MKVAVVGGVTSTLLLIDKLAEYGFADVAVWGYQPSDTKNVSGWVDLSSAAEKYGFKYHSFQKISNSESEIQAYAPDVLFVVGLSQLVSSQLLKAPHLGAIGFHPTALPKGRGRAPIAWLVLNETRGAATFFLMREGADDGPIVTQSFFNIDVEDTAKSVEEKILVSEGLALDAVLPDLKVRILNSIEQDHSLATWTGRRSPEDGCIDWSAPVSTICKLVRASSEPHPGAFTYSDNVTLRIWSAALSSEPIVGVVGRVLSVNSDNGFLVQCSDGVLNVTRWEADQDWKPRVGLRLGYYVESEVHRLRTVCTALEARLAVLEKAICAGGQSSSN